MFWEEGRVQELERQAEDARVKLCVQHNQLYTANNLLTEHDKRLHNIGALVDILLKDVRTIRIDQLDFLLENQKPKVNINEVNALRAEYV